MRARWILTIAVIAGVAGLIYTQTTAAPDNPEVKAEIGKPAPDFTVGDTYGKSFTLSEFKDHIVVLEWVNQDCPVSREKHDKKVMQDTYAKYAEKGVIWLGVDSTAKQKGEKNRVYTAQMRMSYPILMDTDGKVGKAFGAKTTPHMFVIDKSGKLAYDGAIDDKGSTNYVAAALDDLLAEKSVAKSRTKPYGCNVKYAKE